MRTAIIGAGAAGCFCAITLKRRFPDSEVCVYESGIRPLAKVAITGGGRCNLTNSFNGVRSMESVYPRGARLMKRALKTFSHNATMQWFEDEGVRLVVQEDNCVFPASQDAMEIVLTLTRLMENLGVKLILNHRVTDLQSIMSDYDNVVVTTGGAPKPSGLSFLDSLELERVAPVPALFTFNVNDKALHELMGTVVEYATCKLCGTKLQSSTLLITHWGLSGLPYCAFRPTVRDFLPRETMRRMSASTGLASRKSRRLWQNCAATVTATAKNSCQASTQPP